LTNEEAEQLQCTEDRVDPPAHLDCVMKYDPSLGVEDSEKVKVRYGDKAMIRVAPCSSYYAVRDLAASIQNDYQSDQGSI